MFSSQTIKIIWNKKSLLCTADYCKMRDYAGKKLYIISEGKFLFSGAVSERLEEGEGRATKK